VSKAKVSVVYGSKEHKEALKNFRYKYADYMEMTEESERVELIGGAFCVMEPAPSRNHQEVAGNLFYYLKSSLLA